jgi:hypothetical protein
MWGDENPKFNSLFLGARGVADLNSASAGESAYIGVFSPVFANALTEHPLNESLDGPDGKPRESLPARVGSGNATTWARFSDELRAWTEIRYQLIRSNALRARLSDADRHALEDQRTQRVQVIELPR